jgi:hypothetical protein
MPYTAISRPRAPYHSPNGNAGNNWYRYGGYHGGWSHGGWYHGSHHYHVGLYVWAGFPYWYGWGYPYLPAYMNYPGFYGYSPYYPYYDDPAPQQYSDPSAGPYNPPPDQTEPEPPPSYTPWPDTSAAPSSSSEPSSAAVIENAPVTLVFKDGRPREQIHNYMLTSTMLSVLDQRGRDIPVDQIDLPATVAVNREAGIEFALPGASR